MKVRLKVLSGKSAGKEIKLDAGEFLIGRGDGCQLRPRTDAISRKHCRFFVAEDEVRVRDMQSRNGTYVNGQKIDAEVKVKPGDKISVGPLQFELVAGDVELNAVPNRAAPVKATPRGEEAPKKVAKQAAAARSPSGSPADGDIFSWLEEADEVDREERLVDPGTRQFQIKGGQKAADGETVDLGKTGETTTETPTEEKKKKKEPGKLPKAAEKSKTENSQQAAADALRQFFKRT